MENPQAFPTIKTKIKYDGSDNPEHHIEAIGGMTLRDYFAGQALTGFLSHGSPSKEQFQDCDLISLNCYQIADAMLKERLKP